MQAINVLRSGIDELVRTFQRNPFDFLYEADLQGMLFAILVKEYGDTTIQMDGGFWASPNAYGSSSSVRTVPVKCEYPGSQKFDVGVIDPCRIEHFEAREVWEERGWKNDRFWEQRVCAAVEIKYCQLGDNMRRRCAEVQADLEKLREYWDGRAGREFLGVALVFV